MAIRFIEHNEPGYALRTVANARAADLTIAFAVDFTTAGERLTHKASYGKYWKVDIKHLYTPISEIEDLAAHIINRKVKSLNIAGNGIYTLTCSQSKLDIYILEFIGVLHELVDRDFTIRSGGQTGVDEAALKAGDKLGLDCICLAPKNWLFRGIDGRDIKNDPDAFCARFGPAYTNDI